MLDDRDSMTTTPTASVWSRAVASGVAQYRSEEEIALIREAGRIAHRALQAALEACAAGETTSSIAETAAAVVAESGAEPLFLNYRLDGAPPFPAAACVSVNEQIVHGVPGDRVLVEGDLVSIDLGVRCNGWCADTAASVVISASAQDDSMAQRLADCGRETLQAVIDEIGPGVRWSQACNAGRRVAEEAGFVLLRSWAGHGIGRTLHEAPSLPMLAEPGSEEDVVLESGMTLAIEPLLAANPAHTGSRAYADDSSGKFRSSVADDGWTVLSVDGLLTCHFEHTVAVTDRGVETLTAA